MIRLTFLLLMLSTSLVGQVGRTSNFSFSELALSPLSTGLGMNNVSAFAGDVNQIQSNPGLLDSSMASSVSLGYMNYLSDVNQASISYAGLIDSVGMLSGYLRFLDYGSFEEIDEVGSTIGEFGASEYEIGISLSRKYMERITYGFTLKQLFSALYNEFAYGAAVDVGGFYHAENGVSIGFTVDDIGIRVIDYNGNGSSLMRPSLNMGLSKKFVKAPLQLGIQYNNLETWDLASNDIDQIDNLNTNQLTGESKRKVLTFDNFARHLSASVAFVPNEKFNVVGGFNARRRLELSANQRPALIGFSIGARVRISRFVLQYAVSSYHLNGAVNHLGIVTNLNEWYTKKSL